MQPVPLKHLEEKLHSSKTYLDTFRVFYEENVTDDKIYNMLHMMTSQQDESRGQPRISPRIGRPRATPKKVMNPEHYAFYLQDQSETRKQPSRSHHRDYNRLQRGESTVCNNHACSIT